VIDLWDYGPALARHYPELPIGPGEPPRVVIRTLGGLHVTVDGAPIVWKRTNAQILLLDLLIHPEGSTGEELLQRYWPLGDLATLRKDVLTLRQALEPDSPGRQSRYVTLRQGVYRLTQDPGLIGWDVAALRVISRHGLRAARHPQQRARLAAMLADLQGPFVPEFAAYAPLAAFGAKAQSQQDALAAACPGSCRTP
jgi:DNA-binding SARP family transcriptional activator